MNDQNLSLTETASKSGALGPTSIFISEWNYAVLMAILKYKKSATPRPMSAYNQIIVTRMRLGMFAYQGSLLFVLYFLFPFVQNSTAWLIHNLVGVLFQWRHFIPFTIWSDYLSDCGAVFWVINSLLDEDALSCVPFDLIARQFHR